LDTFYQTGASRNYLPTLVLSNWRAIMPFRSPRGNLQKRFLIVGQVKK
jgi:hypothetical protein